ncbi:branched-chain amino acid ABC transporter permease [Siminovitchia acidinfaciens]|uniref:Branched-chain amino acid ABC transporter permease n=1 Tax=Siminovitchia acidinfaciens TaxID=2321395 RepID=A0A429XWU5_9BACI|nr:branched-chain amino acid ABC transporter permease [Siminovitchia acidinfaciens]RST72963.1 branched-chain amino acid ABC transporter permease [Siminovitchia acidinfaciens]
MIDNKNRQKQYIGIALLVAILTIIPFFANSFMLSVLILIGLYAIVTSGLTMLMGYAGQISLGHAAFYGIGAYSAAIVTGTYGLPSILGILTGIVIASVIAVIIGIPTLKLKENYLALATLGFGIIIFVFFKEFKELTGGLNGFFGIPSFEILGFAFNTDMRFYYLVWLILLLSILFSSNIIHSRVGRALRSIHGSDIAANSIGVNIQQYKLQVFVLSAIYASISGSLYAHYVSFINPELFTAMESISLLIMVVIGGSSSIWGGMIGAVVYVLLNEGLKDLVPMVLPSVGGEFQIIFFGVLLVVILIYMPQGLAPALGKLWNLISFSGKKEQPSIKKDETNVSAGGSK